MAITVPSLIFSMALFLFPSIQLRNLEDLYARLCLLSPHLMELVSDRLPSTTLDFRVHPPHNTNTGLVFAGGGRL